MKTSIRNKKGFTIVELVIVIAVIAILAAVLIPTFVSLVNKANVSADMQLVHNLNTALTIDKTENGKHDTMHDAVHALDDYGYDVTKLYKTISEGNMLLWDSVNDVFCLYNGTDECISYYPDGVENKPAKTEMYKYFAVYETVPAVDDQTYSIYYIGTGKTGEGEEEKNDTAEVKVGFDAGHTQINVTYTGDSDVAIRMYGGKLTVNNGNVTVYGFVGELTTEDYSLDFSKIIAAKGTQFHESKGDLEGITDNGAEYDCHLFGEVNAPKCLVAGCDDEEDGINPDHTCIVGEIKHEQGTDGNCDIVVKCAICGKEMYRIDTECKCGGQSSGSSSCEHDYKKETRDAKCDTEGIEMEVCTKCGATQNIKVIPALGHDWKETGRTEASCKEKGKITYTCQREGCNETKARSIAKTEHTYGEWYIDGDKHCRKCGVCSDVQSETHSGTMYIDGEYAVCKTCNAKTTDALLKCVAELNKNLGDASKHPTMYDAFCAVAGKEDYDEVSKIIAKIKTAEGDSGRQIVWDQTIDKFVIAQQSGTSTTVIYTYEGGVTGTLSNGNGSYALWDTYTLDQLADKETKLLINYWDQVYSIYYAGNQNIKVENALKSGNSGYESMSLYVGFDMGFYVHDDSSNKRIIINIYPGSYREQQLIIRTNFTNQPNISGDANDNTYKISSDKNIEQEISIIDLSYSLGNGDFKVKHYGNIDLVRFNWSESQNVAIHYYEYGKTNLLQNKFGGTTLPNTMPQKHNKFYCNYTSGLEKDDILKNLNIIKAYYSDVKEVEYITKYLEILQLPQ